MFLIADNWRPEMTKEARYEGLVVQNGVVIYRTRAMLRQDWAFSEALDWIEANGVTDAEASTEAR